jgi:subtilisin family serine protease
MRAICSLLSIAVPLSLALSAAPAFAQPSAKLVQHSDAVAGEYIVVLAPSQDAADDERAGLDAKIDRLARAHGGDVHDRFSHALPGFVERLSEEAAAALADDPDVAFVEQNARIYADVTQTNATWGIDRIDQAALPLDTSYRLFADGAGATAYVLDSGVRTTHGEFAGRLLPGYTAIADGRGTNDCTGHGTHVAGTVAGKVLGVAKKTTIVPVRVLGCEGTGSLAGILSGIDWILANKRPRSVVNMSLGGPVSDAQDAAIRKLIAAGITVVASAGNNNVDACLQSPARVPEAITVAATGMTDARAPFSNWGKCVDVFAPGVEIRAASFNGDNLSLVMSGTSQAAPHVTGAVALYLSTHPDATPAQVTQALVAGATLGRVTDPQGSPNRLLATSVADSVAPMAAITSPAADAQVSPSFTVTATATDPNLVRVMLAIDGEVHATLTDPPFTFDVSDIAPGAHMIVVTATDAAAHSTTASSAITVVDEQDDVEGGDGSDPTEDPSTPDDDPGQLVQGGCSAGAGAASWLALVALVGLCRRRRSVGTAR